MITLEYEALRMTVEAGRQVEWTPEEDVKLSEILRYNLYYIVMKNQAQISGTSSLDFYMRSLKGSF